jgi:hypothetical protein
MMSSVHPASPAVSPACTVPVRNARPGTSCWRVRVSMARRLSTTSCQCGMAAPRYIETSTPGGWPGRQALGPAKPGTPNLWPAPGGTEDSGHHLLGALRTMRCDDSSTRAATREAPPGQGRPKHCTRRVCRRLEAATASVAAQKNTRPFFFPSGAPSGCCGQFFSRSIAAVQEQHRERQARSGKEGHTSTTGQAKGKAQRSPKERTVEIFLPEVCSDDEVTRRVHAQRG